MTKQRLGLATVIYTLGIAKRKNYLRQLRKPFVEYTTAWRAVQADARNKAKWDSVMNWLSFGTPGKEQVADENS